LQYYAIASPALDSIAHPPRLLFTGQLYSRNPMQEITDHAWSNKTHQWTAYANGTKSHAADGSTSTYQRPALRLAEMRHYFRGMFPEDRAGFARESYFSEGAGWP
jgi:hypothetical protein